jgi:hypothetical protein
VLGGLAAGGLAALPLAPGNEARAAKCPPCRRKRKNGCKKRVPDTTPCRECGVCLDGVCTPDKVDCGGICMYCDAEARCRRKADGTPCLDTGTCLSGLCQKPV